MTVQRMDHRVHRVRVQLHNPAHRRFLLSRGVSRHLRTLRPFPCRLLSISVFRLLFFQFYHCNRRTLGACQLSEAQIKNVVHRIASYRIARRRLNDSVTSRTRQTCRSLVALSLCQPTNTGLARRLPRGMANALTYRSKSYETCAMTNASLAAFTQPRECDAECYRLTSLNH